MLGYNSLDQRIHQLIQTIAKFNRSFVPSREDDSHTNLAFDFIGQRLVGRWAGSSLGKIILVLDLLEFKFTLFDRFWHPINSWAIEGNTQVQVEEQIESYLSELNLDGKNFRDPLHFKISRYEFVNKAYSKWESMEVLEWMKYRLQANKAAQYVLNHLQVSGEVRIWPHHFDTGIYVEPNERIGLGFGLAMKDNIVSSPCYYFSPYWLNRDEPRDWNMEGIQSGSRIELPNWKGSILRLSEAKEENLFRFIKEIAARYMYLVATAT